MYPYTTSQVDVEIDRLNSHHFKVWLPLTGKLIPTSILSHLKQCPSPRVADVATGTGAWLSSFAEQISPGAEMWGFDLDVTKFPLQNMNVPNLRFHQHDVLYPFPEEMHGKFDLVHVRLLVLGLKDDEWATAVRNSIALLKPGAWIFWEELPQVSVRTLPPSRTFDEWWRVHITYGVEIGRDPLAPYRLQKIFKGAGLEECDERIWSTWGSETLSQEDTSSVLLRSIRPIMNAVESTAALKLSRQQKTWID